MSARRPSTSPEVLDLTLSEQLLAHPSLKNMKSPLKGRISEILEWRAKGLSYEQIAGKLGVTGATLRMFLMRLRKRRRLVSRNVDIESRMEDELVPLCFDNVLQFQLDGGSLKERAQQGAEILKGRGYLKVHQAVKQEATPTQVNLAVQIVMPSGPGMPTLAVGSVVGVPKTLTGEVVNTP